MQGARRSKQASAAGVASAQLHQEAQGNVAEDHERCIAARGGGARCSAEAVAVAEEQGRGPDGEEALCQAVGLDGRAVLTLFEVSTWWDTLQ
jgi:hypothetical protein